MNRLADIVIAGCAPGEPDCNEAPPLDGYIVFWGWTLAILIVLVVTATVIWRVRRQRPTAHADQG